MSFLSGNILVFPVTSDYPNLIEENEKMKNVAFKMITILALFVLVLTACAPAPTPTAAPAAPAAPAAVTTAVTPTEASTTADATPVHLVVWWWGEQEAPGAQKWMNETVANYQKLHPNVTIETVLQSTDALIPAFQSAAAAKSGPDIQYFWGGVYTLENAWNGSIIPMDDLIQKDELSHYINNFERSYDGKQYGIGWYLSGNPMVYNPKLFTKAGLDPKNPPQTWPDLITACNKLNAIGVTPISGGMKDGWFGGWLFSILARQSHDSYKDFMAVSVGNGKFTDPQFSGWWSALDQLKQANCWNKDIGSVDYQQGQDMFVQGKSAMLFSNDTFLKGFADTPGFGWDSMAVMMVPKWSTGKMASEYITTAQGWGITSWSKYPKESADFLMYMHTTDRLKAWWTYTGVLPADDRMDVSLITQPIQKQIFQWDTTVAGANLENFIPSQLDNDANMTGVQLLFSGGKTPAQLSQLSEDTITKWRTQSPDSVTNFQTWSK
jgi:raffinose/stachyose/melibiose transport system substrate-binding protein